MIDAGELDELTPGVARVVAGCLRGLCVTAALGHGDALVGVSVDEQHARAGRDPAEWIGQRVRVGPVIGPALHERLGGGLADGVGEGGSQVAYAGQGHHSGHGRLVGDAEAELTAGRVADDDDPVGVQRLGELSEGGDRRAHVVKRLRHATTVAHPAVLDVPRRPAAIGEIDGQRRHRRTGEARAPEAAV